MSGRGIALQGTFYEGHAGAVERTLQSKLDDIVSVLDFGADPTGATDSAAAVQSAATAAIAAGKWLDFGSGTYNLAAQIAISGRFRARGNATLTTSHATAAIFVANGDLTDFEIRGLKLTTSRVDLVNRGWALIYSDGHSMDGGLIDNVRFDTASSFSNGIEFAAQTGKTLKNVTIRKCIFLGTSAGIELINHADTTVRLSNFSIIDNKFVNNGLLDDQVAGFAVSLSGAHSGFTASQNEITGYPYAGIEVVLPSAGGTFALDYKIHGNTLTNTGRGIIIDATNTTDRAQRLSIIGNTIVGATYFQRFMHMADSEIAGNHVEVVDALTSATRQPEYVSFRDSDRMVVSHNYFNIDLPAAEATKAVVSFIDWSNGKFAANRVRTTGNNCLRFDGSTTTVADNDVTGNTVVYQPSGTTGDPISFQGAGAIRNLLDGNMLKRSIANTLASAAAGNVSRNTMLVRTDTNALSSNELVVQSVSGNTDLSLLTEVKFVSLTGAPAAAFTLTLPSRDGVVRIGNLTGQTANVTAASGSVPIPTGSVADVSVQAGAATAINTVTTPFVAVGQSGGGTATPNANNDATRYSVTDATAFTVATPTNRTLGRVFRVGFTNNSGGAMGAITWSVKYHFSGGAAPAVPTSTQTLYLTFICETTENYEVARSVSMP